MPKRKKHSQPANQKAAQIGFYLEKLALVAAFIQYPSLDDEIWMQRILNRHLLAFVSAKSTPAQPIPVDTLIRVDSAPAASLSQTPLGHMPRPERSW